MIILQQINKIIPSIQIPDANNNFNQLSEELKKFESSTRKQRDILTDFSKQMNNITVANKDMENMVTLSKDRNFLLFLDKYPKVKK